MPRLGVFRYLCRDRYLRRAPWMHVRAAVRCGRIWLIVALSAIAASASPPPEQTRSLTLDAVRVTAPTPTPRALCGLIVAISNHGDRPASRLRFTVKINGRPVNAYDRALFLRPLPPHATTDLRLYNFWTTETFRPEPIDALEIEVTLLSAEWIALGPAPDGVPMSAPIGRVGELPSTKRIVTHLKAPPR